MTKKQKILGEVEIHPYEPFVPNGATSIILGSFPIAKFTKEERPSLKKGEVDFSYGGERNELWNLLAICYKRELKTKDQICQFLQDEKIALGDVIISCRRLGQGSSDTDLRDFTYNVGLKDLIQNSSIKTIYFTSTRVRDIFHRKIGSIPKVKEILLISPSGSGVRQLNELFKELYQTWRKDNPRLKAKDFRVHMYKNIFFK